MRICRGGYAAAVCVFAAAIATLVVDGAKAETGLYPPPTQTLPQQYPGPSQQYPGTSSYPPPPAYPAPIPSSPSLPYQLPPPPFTSAPPSPTGQAGCDVALSADRTTVALVDRATGEEFQHVGLGQDRVQKIYTAPDATWSVATAKVRREQRFYFIALDLAKCEPQEAVAITGPAQEASFAGSEVVLKIGGNEQRFALRNK